MNEPKKEFKILVSGSRDWTDEKTIQNALLDITIPKDSFPVLIHGACKGVDTIAKKIAEKQNWKTRAYPADWSKGKSAGPIRNKLMIDKEHPNVVLCFRKNNSKGTTDMIKHTEVYSKKADSKLKLFLVFEE